MDLTQAEQEIIAIKRKLDRVFKILLNKRVTDPKMDSSTGKEFYNEEGDSTINIHSSEIWSSVIDSDPIVAVTANIAELKTRFTLTEDESVPGHKTWYAEEEGVRIKDWISTKYSLEYEVQLYNQDDDNAKIGPTDDSNWFFDYQTGILTFYGSITGKIDNDQLKPRITAYKYIGEKGVQGGGGGEVDGVVEIKLFPSCTTPYNKSIEQEIAPEQYTEFGGGIGLTNIVFDLAEMLVAGKEVELASYSFACSGYGDGDYMKVYINDTIIEDPWYTREVAEEASIGNGVAVYSIPVDSKIKVDFYNISGTSKLLWFKIKLLYNP